MGKFVGRVTIGNGDAFTTDESLYSPPLSGFANIRDSLVRAGTSEGARSTLSFTASNLVIAATQGGAIEASTTMAAPSDARSGPAIQTRHIITDPRELLLTAPGCGNEDPDAKTFDGYARHAEAAGSANGAVSALPYETSDESGLTVSVGGTVSGVIDTTGDEDIVQVALVAGHTYSVYLYGSGANGINDSFLSIYAPDGTTLIGEDDDGGVGLYSLFTFTAASTGTYNLVAASFNNSGDPGTGDWSMSLHEQGTDSVGQTIATAGSLGIGLTHGFIETSGDRDLYAITLTAGMLYDIKLAAGADYNTDYLAVPSGEVDTVLNIYNASGTLVYSNDDIDFPDDISSAVGFLADTSGTYYVEVRGYAGQAGGYVLDVAETDISTLDPLDAIDWGGPANKVDNSDTLLIYFATDGETYDGVTDLGGWTPYLQQQALAAFQTYSQFANLTFAITTDQSEADFTLVTTESDEYLAYFNPPGTTNAGVGVFAVNGTGWDPDGSLGSMEPGGYGWITFIHEFGHGLGMAHPHDNGGGSEVIPGVTGPFGTFGIFDLNQGVYTTMSYNDGWQLAPGVDANGFPDPDTGDYGFQGTPMALDIALMQIKYGAVDHNTGDNVYMLSDDNVAGTFYQAIWDTGGDDTIGYVGARNATIDLTAATLDYSATGAGVISYVAGIFGGYTIANGVVIENATGSLGDDTLIGNNAANVLTGNGGNDTFIGRGGNDEIHGDEGINTAVFSGNSADYIITAISGGFTIEDTNLGDGDDGTDTLYGVTYAQFADHTINLIDAPGNQAPTLDDLASSVSYLEDDVNAAPQLIDADVTFYDSDGNFDGGYIRVTGLLAEDVVGINSQGNGAGQISTDESDVLYGGVVIGQYSGGIGGTLVITLNAQATSFAVDALLQNLTYSNTSDTPTADRTLTINVTDSEGADLSADISYTPGAFVEQTGVNDPFANPGRLATLDANPLLAFVDVNHDGDIDIIAGTANGAVDGGTLRYFENSGAGTYIEVTGAANPFNGFDVDSTGEGTYSSPATVDIDGDGDLDLVIGSNYGYFFTFENNGNGTWTQLTGAANPLNGVSDPNFSDPTGIDFDGDGDMDLVSGSSFGDVYAIENNGDGTFTILTGAANPFEGIDLGSYTSAASGDLDGDGDDDLIFGLADGTIATYINNGGGSFTQVTGTANPFNGIDVGTYALPVLVDLDGDGDADLVAGDGSGGDTRVWLNTGTFSSASAPTVDIHVTAQNDGPSGTDNAVSIAQDETYVFTVADFGFSDVDGNAFLRVAFFDLPANGVIYLDGVAIEEGDAIAVSQIDAGDLTFVPDAGEHGAIYAYFSFSVGDDGGTADGGHSFDQTPNLFVFEVRPENTPPVLTDLSGGVTFLENTVNAAPQLLDTDVTLADTEGNFDGGQLTVGGLLTEDSVGIRDQGNGAGQIGVSGATISYGGVVIGTFTGGNAGAALTVTFNASATTEAVEHVIENLTYANSSDTPTVSRDLTLNVIDGGGASLFTSGFVEHVGAENPFGSLFASGAGSIPTFVDVDGDGLLDLVSGNEYGSLDVFINQGSGVYFRAGPVANPFDGFYAGTYSAPAAIDVDGDGFVDLVVGSNYGDLVYLQNDGSGGWTYGGILADVSVSRFSTPTAVDLDGDGLQDLVLGSDTGFLYGFHNNGDGTFTELVGLADPFIGVAVGYFSAPAFIDIDGDGDMDAVVGDYYGYASVWTNNNGLFELAADQPFFDSSFASIPAPAFADIDGDGDLDLVFGSVDGDFRVFENVSHSGVTISVDITPESDSAGTAPTGTDNQFGMGRMSFHVMTLGEFGFGDVDGDSFAAVTITTLPVGGRLLLDGTKLTAGQSISAADIAAGKLVYQAGATKGSFTFQVQDSSGAGNLDLTPNTMTIRINNTAPTGTNGTVGVSATADHVVAASEFGFGDIDGNSFASVTLTTLPGSGELLLNGGSVTAGQVVSAADIAAGKLVYRPSMDANGGDSSSFTFQVHDNGGTALGGIDTDQSANTLTYAVQNRAPDGTDMTIGLVPGVDHIVNAAEFGFTDIDGNGFLSVTFTGGTGGRLYLDGVKVLVGQTVSVADITANKLVFHPNPGALEGSVAFQVHDDGGSAYGGTDTDGTANTLTYAMTAEPDNAPHDEAARVVFVSGQDSIPVDDGGAHSITSLDGGKALDRPTLHLAEAQSANAHFDAVIADLLGKSLDHDLGTLVDSMVSDGELASASGDDAYAVSDVVPLGLEAKHFAPVTDRGWAFDHLI